MSTSEITTLKKQREEEHRVNENYRARIGAMTEEIRKLNKAIIKRNNIIKGLREHKKMELFKNCVFNGYPPRPFNSWSEWWESRPLQGVVLAAGDPTPKGAALSVPDNLFELEDYQ